MSLPAGYTWHRAGRVGWGYLCVPLSEPARRDFDAYAAGRWIISDGPGCMRVYCRTESGPELLRDIEQFEQARAVQ